ncbi:DUF6300 family protein [Nonomuraea muscovyensis]|uniref:DUF6300 family protein n=1 Tax=Nonomuraea muscovyensis TaxID=1124761 RepID=UPI0033F16AE4
MMGRPDGSGVVGGAVCPHCGIGDVLAVLRLSHTWTNASGGLVSGVSDVLLCGRCDAADPVAGPVVTYFAVHGWCGRGRWRSSRRVCGAGSTRRGTAARSGRAGGRGRGRRLVPRRAVTGVVTRRAV